MFESTIHRKGTDIPREENYASIQILNLELLPSDYQRPALRLYELLTLYLRGELYFILYERTVLY